MANWIQGHNDQFGFKAIVCHDGIFSTTSAFYETEEVWFPTRCVVANSVYMVQAEQLTFIGSSTEIQLGNGRCSKSKPDRRCRLPMWV